MLSRVIVQTGSVIRADSLWLRLPVGIESSDFRLRSACPADEETVLTVVFDVGSLLEARRHEFAVNKGTARDAAFGVPPGPMLRFGGLGARNAITVSASVVLPSGDKLHRLVLSVALSSSPGNQRLQASRGKPR